MKTQMTLFVLWVHVKVPVTARYYQSGVPSAVSRFIKYTGYGNAAGLLVARGLLAGGRGASCYSDDEDSDTEEYKEAKAQ